MLWLATRAGKMEQYCPLGQVHQSFLSQNIFRDSKNIFCDFSVGMELENEKTETCRHFRKLWLHVTLGQ